MTSQFSPSFVLPLSLKPLCIAFDAKIPCFCNHCNFMNSKD